MGRSVSLTIIGILVIGVAAGAFFFLNVNQPQAQQIGSESGVKDVRRDQVIMERDSAIVFKNVDGGQISLAELLKGGKPVLIYFFTTWCPVCDADLKSLNSVYGKYQGKIDVLVVGFDPTENAEQIRQYRESKGYSWPFAEFNKDAILRFKVVTQATKIGFDAKGSIVFSDGYMVLSASDWTSRLEKLVS